MWPGKRPRLQTTRSTSQGDTPDDKQHAPSPRFSFMTEQNSNRPRYESEYGTTTVPYCLVESSLVNSCPVGGGGIICQILLKIP